MRLDITEVLKVLVTQIAFEGFLHTCGTNYREGRGRAGSTSYLRGRAGSTVYTAPLCGIIQTSVCLVVFGC